MKEKQSKFPRLENHCNDGKIYQKIRKRYYPVSDIHAHDGLGVGSWLVIVNDGCTSIRRSIEPDNAAVEVAFKITEDELTKIIGRYSEARPKTTPLTPKEQKAMAAYYKVMKGEPAMLYFTYPAMQTMAQEILKELRTNSENKVRKQKEQAEIKY